MTEPPHTADRGDFTEIIEDPELASRLADGKPVTFRVLEDRWTGLDSSQPVRTIVRAEILDA